MRTAIAQSHIKTTESGGSQEHWAKRFHHTRAKVSTEKFCFAFVRHPVSWYRSRWLYRMATGWVRHPVDDVCRSDNYSEFVRSLITHFPGYLSKLYEDYVGTVSLPIDFVGRQENLVDDLICALRLAGEDFDESVIRSLPPQNQSRKSRNLGETTSVDKQIIEAESKAISRFYS